ncbi:MAG: hypothetical protein IPO21_11960 [Bacteroidales bacterium]|nr:hypothetical protein [Bacteroidales bacterium]
MFSQLLKRLFRNSKEISQIQVTHNELIKNLFVELKDNDRMLEFSPISLYDDNYRIIHTINFN